MLNFIGEDKKKDQRNLFSKITDVLFGNVKKFAGTAKAGAGGVAGLGKVGAASLFGSDEDYLRTLAGVEQTLERDLAPGKTFFKSPEEAANISGAELAKRTLGAGLGTAAEVVPLARGAQLATKGGSFVKNIPRVFPETAGYGAAYTGGQQLVEEGRVDPFDLVKGALVSGTLGTAGYGAIRGIGAAARGGKRISSELANVAEQHPAVLAHDDSYKILQVAYDNAPSAQAKKQISKALTENRQSRLEEIKKVREGGYVQLPGKEPEPVRKAIDAINAPTKTAQQIELKLEPQRPKSIVEALDEQLGKYKPEYKVPESLKPVLERTGKVGTPASRQAWTEAFRDTTGVMGAHFGETGTTATYKLQQGAKLVSDLEEAVRDDIVRSQKLLNKLAKSDVGRADVQSRIYAALEDRANVDQYLRGKTERELYDATVRVFDFFKAQRQARGLGILENYSPRTEVKNALDAPDRMLQNVKMAFSPKTQSQFSKTRINDMPETDINKRIVELIPHYVSSQAKEFGYTDAMEFIRKNLPNVSPAYIANVESRRRGENYLQTLLTQILQPKQPTKLERIQTKAIQQTYRSALGFSPKFALQNITQRFATRSQVSKDALKLVKKMDEADLDDLRKGITTGFNPITQEMEQTATSVGGKIARFRELDPALKVERGNVKGAFDRGVAQGIIESDAYQAALRAGLKSKEAVKRALEDPATRDLAVRRGNMVVNTTQFGGNFAAKPEFLRATGTIQGLFSKKWYQQYQRFPTGMLQLIGNIATPKRARALDILRRGDPRQTPIVDYWKAAQGLESGVDDLIRGIKSKEITNVSLKDAQVYKSMLSEAVKGLEKEMKQVSQIRGRRTAKNLAKMWLYASAVQFLFDGGFSSRTAQEKGGAAELQVAAKFGAPFNIPTREQSPITGAQVPSLPYPGSSRAQIQRKALNFIPVVGPIVARSRDVERLMTALTGE